MGNTEAKTIGGAAPMRGPNYILGVIKSYEDSNDQDGVLLLQDGTSWRVLRSDGDHDANSRLILLARCAGLIFISGDSATTIIDRVAIPRALSALSVGAPIEGRYSVSFAGPPSIYYLFKPRPWASMALDLLSQSVRMQPPLDQPDLLVSIDVVTSEIMDVRSIEPAKGGK